MKRLWLALVAVALIGGTAQAFMPHRKCTCGQDGVSLPRNGAVGVPTNTRVWRLFRNTPPSGGPLPQLEPHAAYDLPWYHVSFTTGDGPDREAPTQPRIGVVSIAVTGASPHGRRDVASLQISGAFSADTALLRIELLDAGRVTTFYMPAAESWICEPGFALHAGIIHGELTAIDLAGNESPPVPFEAQSTFVAAFASSCPNPELDYNEVEYAHEDPPTETGPSAVVYGPLGLDVAGGVLILIAASRRSRKRASATTEPLAITAAEQLARRMRLLSALGALGLIAVVVAIAPLAPEIADALTLLSPLLLWALWAALASWWAATRLLPLAARDGAVIIVRHDLIEVALADGGASLACPRRLIVRAQRNALPKATTL